MDPVKKIKDHIIALNSVSYEDDVHLELYLSQLKETLFQVFGSQSQYVTYLNSIRFHPISLSASAEAHVRAWAMGKKQVRDLLFVVLGDPVLKEYESWDEREVGTAEGELAAAEKIVEAAERRSAVQAPREEIRSSLEDVVKAFKNRVRVDVSLADNRNRELWDAGIRGRLSGVARIRIDLRDLDIVDDGMEKYFVHRSAFLPKNRTKRVLLVLSSDDALNERVRRFLSTAEAEVVEIGMAKLGNKKLTELRSKETLYQMAVVLLTPDVSMPVSGGMNGGKMWTPSPLASFHLGCLVSQLGSRRVVAFFAESLEIYRPFGHSELPYVSVQSSGLWREDLARCLKEADIGVFDPAWPSFYVG